MLRRRAEEVVTLMNKIESEFEEQADIEGVISIGSGGLLTMRFLGLAMDSFGRNIRKCSISFIQTALNM